MASVRSIFSQSKSIPRRIALFQAAFGGFISAKPAFGAAKSLQTYTLESGERAQVDANLIFAAVQMQPDISNPTRTVAGMVKAMGEVSVCKPALALIAFPIGMFESIHRDGTNFETLVATAQKLDCVLTFGAKAVFDAKGAILVNARILVEPCGLVSIAQRHIPLVKNTKVGRLAMRPPGCQSDLLGEDVEVDILLQSDQKDDSLSNIQTNRLLGTLCSIVVNQASLKEASRCAPTAIFDGRGRMATQTGRRWSQTIVASLPRRFQ